jgi:catechol 2,3-dioxygenase-like lactoylglutathione lyase family enzyme
MEVGFCCRDLDALARFYTEVLGFELINVVEVDAPQAREAALSNDAYRVARLQTPWGERIKLLQPTKAPEDSVASDWILDRCNNAYVTFIVDDLATMLERLKGKVTLLTGPERIEVRSGVWLAFVRDPEGNLLEFVEYDDLPAYREDLRSDRKPKARV